MMTRDNGQTSAAAGQAPCHEARALTDGGQLASIRLDDHIYTLRITRAGKLLLTK